MGDTSIKKQPLQRGAVVLSGLASHHDVKDGLASFFGDMRSFDFFVQLQTLLQPANLSTRQILFGDINRRAGCVGRTGVPSPPTRSVGIRANELLLVGNGPHRRIDL